MATYYVNRGTGDDGNAGGSGDPWENIWYAWTQVSNGDTIRVQKATPYPDSFNVLNSPSNVTLRADNPADPAVITMSGQWRFDGVGGITIQDLDFNEYTAQAINLGYTSRVTDFLIDSCKFRHSTKASVRINDCNGFTIRDTLIRDIRSRQVGVGRIPIIIPSGGWCRNFLMQRCYGEDNGDKTFENIDTSILRDATFEDCVFWVNRPYSTSGTSPHDGATTTWQDAFGNVSEGGLDFKGTLSGYTENVLVQRCSFHGFYHSIVGQDCTGGKGEGVLVHNDADDITVEDCHFYDCDIPIVCAKGTDGTTAGMVARRNFIEGANDFGIDCRDANLGITFDDNIMVNPVASALRLNDVTIDSFKRNLLIGGTYNRGGTIVGENPGGNFDYNFWDLDVSPPSQWVGSNDLSTGTVNIQRINCLDGGAALYFERAGIDLSAVFISHMLDYHPSLSTLQTNLDAVLDALSSSSFVTALVEEATGRYSLELSW